MIKLRPNKSELTSLMAGAFVASAVLSGCVRPGSGLSFSQKYPAAFAAPASGSLSASRIELDDFTAKSVEKYSPIVQKYGIKYELDWRLVLAVMKQESSFRPNAKSRVGAYGLMQIMPGTQADLSERLGVPNARAPYYNIKAGMYHLRTLYRYFDGIQFDDRIRLSLAAYNAGLTRVNDARDIAKYLGLDPDAWSSLRRTLPMLSSDYSTLHQRVWSNGRPRGGRFKGWSETINYVDNIMSYYNDFQLALQ